MRVTKTGNQPKPIVEGLQEVVEFLNAIDSDTTTSQWEKYLNAFLKKNGPISPFFSVATDIQTGRGRNAPRLSLEEWKQLRWWMNNDLGFVRAEKPFAMPFEALVYRLNELKFQLGWQCDAAPQRFKRFNSSQAIVKIRWGDGTTGRWATISWPITKTPKDHFYAILGKALETGDLTRLKVCRQCGKYLVTVKDRKRDFCEGTTCKDDFHSGQRKKVGYYTDRRQAQRKDAIKKARQLLAAGRAQRIPRRTLFEQIEKATRLPQREVDKIFGED
jgi:hypothetical protein